MIFLSHSVHKPMLCFLILSIWLTQARIKPQQSTCPCLTAVRLPQANGFSHARGDTEARSPCFPCLTPLQQDSTLGVPLFSYCKPEKEARERLGKAVFSASKSFSKNKFFERPTNQCLPSAVWAEAVNPLKESQRSVLLFSIKHIMSPKI